MASSVTPELSFDEQRTLKRLHQENICEGTKSTASSFVGALFLIGGVALCAISVLKWVLIPGINLFSVVFLPGLLPGSLAIILAVALFLAGKHLQKRTEAVHQRWAEAIHPMTLRASLPNKQRAKAFFEERIFEKTPSPVKRDLIRRLLPLYRPAPPPAIKNALDEMSTKLDKKFC